MKNRLRSAKESAKQTASEALLSSDRRQDAPLAHESISWQTRPTGFYSTPNRATCSDVSLISTWFSCFAAIRIFSGSGSRENLGMRVVAGLLAAVTISSSRRNIVTQCSPTTAPSFSPYVDKVKPPLASRRPCATFPEFTCPAATGANTILPPPNGTPSMVTIPWTGATSNAASLPHPETLSNSNATKETELPQEHARRNMIAANRWLIKTIDDLPIHSVA